ncbi:MAG: molybdenum ABC transporter ATP-binding protein [Chloroflexi bacterium]|nr:molybdenum ABC transporter ATP-binding protein [Chloroflexota bacterium]
MKESPAVLKFEVIKRSGDFVLDVHAECGPGITAIFGPSGSGKTTTLNCIAGLVTPDSGEVELAGRTLYSSRSRVNLPPERRRIGYVFQEGALFPHLTVGQNIRFGYDRTPRPERRLDPDHLVELLGLGPMLDRLPQSLSGGERQRVGIARALATSPQCLLLDEPLAALDVRLGGIVLAYLRRVRRELRIPMIYVSHHVSTVLALADHALLFSDGRVIKSGRPAQVVLDAVSAAATEFGFLDNVLDGRVLDPGDDLRPGRVKVGDAELVTQALAMPQNATVEIYIGAAEIILAGARPERLSARNIVEARITQVERSRGRALVTADIGVPLLVQVTQAALEELRIREGGSVFLVFKSTSIGVVEVPEGGPDR